MAPLILGISGASGIPLAFKALTRLVELGESVDLVMTREAQLTAATEFNSEVHSPQKMIEQLPKDQQHLVRSWKIYDFLAPIASGSYLTKGMMIIPCSMATLGAISMGLSDNLLRRAADVTLKENRKLLIAPREAPFNQIHLENMLKLSKMGVIIHPPVPAWYANPQSLSDVEDFMVNRMLDHFIPEKLKYARWGQPQAAEEKMAEK